MTYLDDVQKVIDLNLDFSPSSFDRAPDLLIFYVAV